MLYQTRMCFFYWTRKKRLMRRLFGTCGGARESNDYFFLALTLILPFATIVTLGGVCQLKSRSYLQYTTCNHSEQVFSYRSEPTFIQTRHFSLDSQVLDFTHTKKDREYQISSCINFSTHFNKLIRLFWKKSP